MMGDQRSLHIAMYPWFAFGHLNPFLNLSNKFAENGHRVSFFLPTNTQPKLEPFNFYPDQIKFIPLTIPEVKGLPPGSETTSNVPLALHHLLMTAMDLTRPQVESALRELKPDYVFYDFTHWLPEVTKELGIKACLYCIISMASVSYLLVPASIKVRHGSAWSYIYACLVFFDCPTGSSSEITEDEWMQQPPGFPESSIRLHRYEAKMMSFITYRDYGRISFHERLTLSYKNADALCFRSCMEIEGAFMDFVQQQYGKPVFLSGPLLPKAPTTTLEEKWEMWLNKFEPRSVIFCAFGSECYMKKEQFQELLLGFELTDMPFLLALKPPLGVETMEEALPEGYKERIEGRGVVESGWIQQQLIMAHPSIGCFVSHCGLSSVTETLVNNPQLVLLPNAGDQFIIARLMGRDLKVGVEVEKREDDGWFTKESVCKAIKTVMEEDNEIGKVVMENRFKLKDLLLRPGFEEDYITGFIDKFKAGW